MKELVIASNMIALARSRKGANKRSAMLRMIMPFLSKETGDELAGAIADSNSVKFSKMWDKMKGEIVHKLKDSRPKQLKKPKEVGGNHAPKPHAAPHHKKPHVAKPKHAAKKHFKGHASSEQATAADVTTFNREEGTSVCIKTYGPEKLRISLNGNTAFEAVVQDQNEITCTNPDAMGEGQAVNPPARTSEPQVTVQIDEVDTGSNYVIADKKIIALIKAVCEEMLVNADPCPLPRVPVKQVCENHDWEDCPQCFPQGVELPPDFDFAANILELYDRLCTAKA